MPLLTYSFSDFVAYTKIKSTEVQGKFNDIKTLLNTTGLDDANIANAGITRSTKLKAGGANHVVINDGSGNMTDEAQLAKTRGGTGVDLTAAALEVPEIATPTAAPASTLRIYGKSDNKLYTMDPTGTESQVGSGGGQGGINYLILDTSFLPTKSTNSDAETTVGDWAAYSDGSAVPVDMTGGTPVTTIARSTTAADLLDGIGSFKITKDGINRQGEGVSCTANVPVAYRGSRQKITFPWKITSGSIQSGDLKVYAYDVTNAQLITPGFVVSDLVGSQGVFLAYFDLLSTTTQIRVGIHIASTTTTAFTMSIDDVKCGPNDVVRGMAGSDWNAYTPTLSTDGTACAKGTTTIDAGYWRRVGDSMEIVYDFKQSSAGTAGTGSYLIGLPTGYNIDSSKVTVNTDYVSTSGTVGTMYLTNASSTGFGPAFAYDSTHIAARLIKDGTFAYQAWNATQFALDASTRFTITVRVPIAGWSSNVSMGDSSTFRISSYLANGTRVTGSAPTALGQYRSYLRNASAATFTETNGDPTAAPTTADGIRIYNGNAWGSADNAHEPTRYEIFVGKNKNVRVNWFASAGRTGVVDASPVTTGTTDFGYFTSYDPTTGIVTVVGTLTSGGNRTAHTSGSDASGAGTINPVNDIYFDIIVSDNVLAVGTQSVRSAIHLDTYAGYGATDTKIPYFTNSSTTGTALTLTTNNATNGASITLNEDGVYAIAHGMQSAVGGFGYAGISKNASGTDRTTTVLSLATTVRVAAGLTPSVGGETGMPTATWVGFLPAGTVIRPHENGDVPSTASVCYFDICKVNS